MMKLGHYFFIWMRSNIDSCWYILRVPAGFLSSFSRLTIFIFVSWLGVSNCAMALIFKPKSYLSFRVSIVLMADSLVAKFSSPVLFEIPNYYFLSTLMPRSSFSSINRVISVALTLGWRFLKNIPQTLVGLTGPLYLSCCKLSFTLTTLCLWISRGDLFLSPPPTTNTL